MPSSVNGEHVFFDGHVARQQAPRWIGQSKRCQAVIYKIEKARPCSLLVNTAPPTGEPYRAAGDVGRVLPDVLAGERDGDGHDVGGGRDRYEQHEEHVTAEVLLQRHALQAESGSCTYHCAHFDTL